MYYTAVIVMCSILFFIDLKWNILVSFMGALISLTVVSHTAAFFVMSGILVPEDMIVPVRIVLFLAGIWFLIRFTLYIPQTEFPLSLRIRLMMGGRRIFLVSQLNFLFQLPLCSLEVIYGQHLGLSRAMLIADISVTALLFFLFSINGALRMMVTSRRLGVIKRVVFLLFAGVPGINTALGLWFCSIVKREFIFESQKVEVQNSREESEICRTQYPLLMLHGCGFRDYRYVNYWGRIPALLIRNGATIYYGHQQGWGTIRHNAEEVKQRIIDIKGETGCNKVNIIAHSKGGLDARYCISSLGMGDSVASLTTISTPHHGSELIPVLEKLGDAPYRRICRMIDMVFRGLGDTNPDCYSSSKELSPPYSETFNKENPDDVRVFYQSYGSAMKTPASHSLLTIPSVLMKFAAGKNDGLVSIDSAQWGKYKGTFESSDHRGISHADQIDLMHQDYEGFNIPEEYVTIVAELKEMGF